MGEAGRRKREAREAGEIQPQLNVWRSKGGDQRIPCIGESRLRGTTGKSHSRFMICEVHEASELSTY